MAGRFWVTRWIGCMALAALASAPLLDDRAVAAAQKMDMPMWDLSDLYPTPDAWLAEYDRMKSEAQRLEDYKGTLGSSAAAMLAALDAIARVNKETSRLFTYASLKADEDLSNPRNQERKQQAGALNTLIGERTAWLAPEILSLGAPKVQAFLREDRTLAERHDFFLNNILRAAPHTLGLEAESVLASAGDVLQQPDSIYGQFANSDLPYPMVTLSDGTKVRLDQSAYEKYRQSANRADRKLVFDSFWDTWKSYESTDGAILTARIMGNVFTAKARKHPNALAAALFPDNMPEEVYRTLVAQANAGLPTLHRYFKLRKRLLGIPGELEYYDVYPTMFPSRNIPKIHARGFDAAFIDRARALWRGISGLAQARLRRQMDGALPTRA